MVLLFPAQNMIITQHIIIVYVTYLTLCIVHTYILYIFQQLNQLSSSFSGTWLSGSSLAFPLMNIHNFSLHWHQTHRTAPLFKNKPSLWLTLPLIKLICNANPQCRPNEPLSITQRGCTYDGVHPSVLAIKRCNANAVR